MPVRVQCDCGYAFGVANKHAGQRIRCPECRNAVLVPGGQRPTQRESKRIDAAGRIATSREADREARNTKTTGLVVLSFVVLIITLVALMIGNGESGPLPMSHVIDPPPRPLSRGPSQQKDASGANLTAEKPQLAEKEPEPKLPAEKELPPAKPVFTDPFAAALKSDKDVSLVGGRSTVENTYKGGFLGDVKIKFERNNFSFARVKGVWYGHVQEPVDPLDLVDLQTGLTGRQRRERAKDRETTRRRGGTGSTFGPPWWQQGQSSIPNQRTQAGKPNSQKARLEIRREHQTQNRNLILNQPWSSEQLNFVRATDRYIELYCPKYQTLHVLSASGARRTVYRSQLTGRISAFEDRTERSLNLTGGKWHFGIDKAYWLNAVRPFPVHPSIAEQGDQSLEEIIAGVRRNVVQVKVVTASGEKRLGSGFILDSGGKIVTNYHVVQNAVAIRVAFPSRQGVVPPQAAVGVLHANPDEDLVVLQSHMPPMHHYPGLGLGWGLPEVGATVGSVSMAMGMDRISGTGTVNAVRLGEKLEEVVEVHDRKGFWIQTTTPFSPGADGSPLFDKTGAVIGVMTFTLERGQNLNFAVSIESLRNVKYPVHLFQIKAISPNNLPTSVRAYGL